MPSIAPGLVRCCGSGSGIAVTESKLAAGFSVTVANPKSRILACPRSVAKMFAGLMSRWTMPLPCAASSASAISIASGKICSESSGRLAIRCLSVWPSRNSTP